MTSEERRIKNIKIQNQLIQNEIAHGREWSQTEKDINNLKIMRYGIDPNSIWARNGCLSSLDRAIGTLYAQSWHKPDDKPTTWMDVLLCYEDLEAEVFISPGFHIVSGYYSNESETYIYQHFNRDFVNVLGRATVKLIGWMPLPEPPLWDKSKNEYTV